MIPQVRVELTWQLLIAKCVRVGVSMTVEHQVLHLAKLINAHVGVMSHQLQLH